jgi:hypothetical protein
MSPSLRCKHLTLILVLFGTLFLATGCISERAATSADVDDDLVHKNALKVNALRFLPKP